MKNVSRIKFLHCFRRPVVDDVMLEPRRRRNQLMHLLMDEGCDEKAGAKSLCRRSRKHSFSRMLKSALFDTALARSIRRKRSGSLRKLLLKKRFDSMDDEPRAPLHDDNNRKLINEQMNRYPSTSPSICSSSALENGDRASKPLSEGSFSYSDLSMKPEQSPDHQDQPRMKRAKLDMACLLFVSLTGTVLCGRACAILFASMWLLAVARWLRRGVMDDDNNDDEVRIGRLKKVKVLQVETDAQKRRKTGVQLIMDVLGRMCEGKSPKK